MDVTLDYMWKKGINTYPLFSVGKFLNLNNFNYLKIKL